MSAHKRGGVRGIGTSYAVPAYRYIHPEFGFFCPTSRFRRRLRVALACLVVAGVGTAVIVRADRPESDAAVKRLDEASIIKTVPATSLTPFTSLSSNLTVVQGAQPAADKPSCDGDALADLDGNCVPIRLRKPRMVRVPTHRPAIASVALGRTASLSAINIEAALPGASAGREGDPEKSGQAASASVAAADSAEPSQKAAATPKKAQRSAHRQNQRRDQNWYGAPSWREVRLDDWAARGYAPRESDYQRGAHGQGFVRNFR
jgi:hypothetical protein